MLTQLYRNRELWKDNCFTTRKHMTEMSHKCASGSSLIRTSSLNPLYNLCKHSVGISVYLNTGNMVNISLHHYQECKDHSYYIFQEQTKYFEHRILPTSNHSASLSDLNFSLVTNNVLWISVIMQR